MRARAGFQGLPFSVDEETMSAAKLQQQLAKTTSWLAQLKGNAEWAGFNVAHVEQLARERYGKPLDELTVTEAQTLAWEYADIGRRKAEANRAARTPISGPRTHDCITCYEPVKCHKDNCRETMSEHHHCHEGFGRQEYGRTYRNSF
jgi:hypothetical protein